MVQMKSASTPKVERKENVLDASKLESVKVDAQKKAEEGSNGKPGVANVTAVAS